MLIERWSSVGRLVRVKVWVGVGGLVGGEELEERNGAGEGDGDGSCWSRGIM